MNDAVERRLRAIEDAQAIIRLKAAYCDGWHRGWKPVPADGCERVLELFVENAIWDTSPFGRCEGREEFRQAFQALASQPLGLHCVTNPTSRLTTTALTEAVQQRRRRKAPGPRDGRSGAAKCLGDPKHPRGGFWAPRLTKRQDPMLQHARRAGLQAKPAGHLNPPRYLKASRQPT
jgi:hypothetical protein